MKIPTNIQYIEQNGKPVYAVIPYDEYIKLLPSEDVTIPHEVVGLVIKKGMNLVKAWRTYLGITQSDSFSTVADDFKNSVSIESIC